MKARIYTTINNIEMSQKEYLYGSGTIVPNIPQDVIDERIKLLEKHLEQLLEVDYMRRDDGRIRKILKAIDFWKEIKGN